MGKDMTCPRCRKKGSDSEGVDWKANPPLKCSACGFWFEADRWELIGEWVKVSDRLPLIGKPVLVFIAPDKWGAYFILRARYVSCKSWEFPDVDGECIVDEETGIRYYKEGWYGANSYTDYMTAETEIVGITHWMSLPLRPRD